MNKDVRGESGSRKLSRKHATRQESRQNIPKSQSCWFFFLSLRPFLWDREAVLDAFVVKKGHFQRILWPGFLVRRWAKMSLPKIAESMEFCLQLSLQMMSAAVHDGSPSATEVKEILYRVNSQSKWRHINMLLSLQWVFLLLIHCNAALLNSCSGSGTVNYNVVLAPSGLFEPAGTTV